MYISNSGIPYTMFTYPLEYLAPAWWMVEVRRLFKSLARYNIAWRAAVSN